VSPWRHGVAVMAVTQLCEQDYRYSVTQNPNGDGNISSLNLNNVHKVQGKLGPIISLIPLDFTFIVQ